MARKILWIPERESDGAYLGNFECYASTLEDALGIIFENMQSASSDDLFVISGNEIFRLDFSVDYWHEEHYRIVSVQEP